MRWYGTVRRFLDLRIIQISTEDATTDTIDDTDDRMAIVLLSHGKRGWNASNVYSGVVSFIVLLILSLLQGMNFVSVKLNSMREIEFEREFVREIEYVGPVMLQKVGQIWRERNDVPGKNELR